MPHTFQGDTGSRWVGGQQILYNRTDILWDESKDILGVKMSGARVSSGGT